MIKNLLNELVSLSARRIRDKNYKKKVIFNLDDLYRYEAFLFDFKLPNDLREFYIWFYERNMFYKEDLFYFLSDGIFDLDSAINERVWTSKNIKESTDNECVWPLAWLPIAHYDVTGVLAVLSKEKNEETILLQTYHGDGDLNGYLFFSSIENFLKCEIEIAKILNIRINSMEEIDEIMRKYSPNAYDISDNVLTDDYFNSQGCQNVFDISDLTSIPKEWL